MPTTNATQRAELAVAWVVALGVAIAGIYDFVGGQAPKGALDLSASLALPIFLASCLATALLASALAIRQSGASQGALRLALVVVVVSVVPALLGDPTYGSLTLAIPLIDIRRRSDEPDRTLWTLAILGIASWLLLTESTPRITAEYEAMFGLAIAFITIVILGDALRQLDRAITAETRLAKLTERNRLAEDLHDSVGHHLLASSVQLQKAKAMRSTKPEAAEGAVDLASQAIAEAISETRLIVDTTRNQQPFRIEPALRDLTRRIIPSGTEVTVEIHGDHEPVDQAAQVAIYRVAQEALSNLVRHSSARTARVVSSVNDEEVKLEISDDGGGFDLAATKEAGGLGNMRRRIAELGGTCDITSSIAGTSILATVPR